MRKDLGCKLWRVLCLKPKMPALSARRIKQKLVREVLYVRLYISGEWGEMGSRMMLDRWRL
jgi:hypothetical protein